MYDGTKLMRTTRVQRLLRRGPSVREYFLLRSTLDAEVAVINRSDHLQLLWRKTPRRM